MKNSIILSAIVFTIFSLCSCKKDGGDIHEMKKKDTQQKFPDALNEDQNNFLNSIPPANGMNEENIVLPNGQTIKNYMKEMDSLFLKKWGKNARIASSGFEGLGPQDARNLLLARMNLVALNLTDKNLHNYPDEGPGKPAQDHIVYSYGSKNWVDRMKPASDCAHMVHGLDCSGFIYQVFFNAGIINMPMGNAENQAKTATLENAIKSSVPELQAIEVTNLGKLAADKLETGDIVGWGFHIGIIMKGFDGKLGLYQSNGTPNGCTDNLSKGATRLDFSTGTQWFGGNYTVIRINAKISGNWAFHFRCAGTSVDFKVLDLNFPTTNNNNFSITNIFTDLDGSTNTVIFDFTYNRSTNVLSCISVMTDGSIPDFERRDSFSVKLERDDTGYIPADNEYIHNGSGCLMEVRLENKERISI